MSEGKGQPFLFRHYKKKKVSLPSLFHSITLSLSPSHSATDQWRKNTQKIQFRQSIFTKTKKDGIYLAVPKQIQGDTVRRTKLQPAFRYAHDTVQLMSIQAQYPFLVRYPDEPILTMLDTLVSKHDVQRAHEIDLSEPQYHLPKKPVPKTTPSYEFKTPSSETEEYAWWIDLGPKSPEYPQIENIDWKRKLEARIRNSLLFSRDEENLIAHMFGLFGAPMCTNHAFQECFQTPTDLLAKQTVICVKKLRPEIWPKVFIPFWWLWEDDHVKELRNRLFLNPILT